MIVLVMTLALMGQATPPSDTFASVLPGNGDWVFRANVPAPPGTPICAADTPDSGKPAREVLTDLFHINASATLTQTLCGKEVKHVDVTPREAALLLGLFQPRNYDVEDEVKGQACANATSNLYEMTAQQTGRIEFQCTPPETLGQLVGDLRKMMVAQYAN